jgi:hypothetical protein
MLRLQPGCERDTVWDALLPAGVTMLPADLARVDELLSCLNAASTRATRP